MKVESYASAGEFLKKLPFEGRACVILDLMLPDTTGLELCDRMAALGCSLPVIFLTGGSNSALRDQATNQSLPNAVAFFTKPVDSKILLNAVRLALDR